MSRYKYIGTKRIKFTAAEEATSDAQEAADKATFDASLPQRKLEAIALLNERAERERLKYVSPGSAKAMEYLEKKTEATNILNDPNPVATNYHYAAARAASTGMTLMQVATEWDAKAKAWILIGAAISDAAEVASKLISSLTVSVTLETDAAAIIDAIVWPVPPGP